MSSFNFAVHTISICYGAMLWIEDREEFPQEHVREDSLETEEFEKLKTYLNSSLNEFFSRAEPGEVEPLDDISIDLSCREVKALHKFLHFFVEYQERFPVYVKLRLAAPPDLKRAFNETGNLMKLLRSDVNE